MRAVRTTEELEHRQQAEIEGGRRASRGNRDRGAGGRTRRRRVPKALWASLAAAGLVFAIAPVASAAGGTLLNPTPAPGGGQNGRANDVTISGGIAYVVGSFSQASSGGQTFARKNVAAFTVSGANVTGFTANTNGAVYAVIADATSVYLGGDFTKVNGVTATRIAKVSKSTGAVQSFAANANNSVRGLATLGGRLYVAGFFTKLNNAAVAYAGAVSTASGALDTGFKPQPDNKGYAAEVGPGGTVYLGGLFKKLGGTARNHLSQVNPTTGAPVGPAVFKGLTGRILDISLSPDGGRVLGASDDGQNTCFSWTASSGAKNWGVKIDGDCQDLVSLNGNVYFGFHDGYQGVNTLRLMAADATTGAVQAGFQPTANGLKGVVGLATDGTHLVAVGDFNKINGQSVAGVAVFS